jgi:CRISPR-associated protein Cas6/Cse3/CasE subtype I-E
MYHSHLMINVGANPDRPDWNICRRWLRNLYRVHQRLCWAFPSAKLKEQTGDRNFLFRIDYPVDVKRGGRKPVIIVQSSSLEPPDWDCAFGLTKGVIDNQGRPVGNAGFLLAAPPQVQKVSINIDDDTLALNGLKQNYRIRPGDLVRFRLRANPTRKIQDGSRNGKRRRIKPEIVDHIGWLSGKLADALDSPICIENFVPGWAYGWRSKYEPKGEHPMQWWSVLFEGSFRLGNPVALKQLLESGIGPAKAFGFGLLSVAPG